MGGQKRGARINTQYTQEERVFQALAKVQESLQEFVGILDSYTVEELQEAEREYNDLNHYLELEGNKSDEPAENERIQLYITQLMMKNRQNRRGLKDVLDVKRDIYDTCEATKNLIETTMTKLNKVRKYVVRSPIGADVLQNIENIREGKEVTPIYDKDFTRRNYYKTDVTKNQQTILQKELLYTVPNGLAKDTPIIEQPNVTTQTTIVVQPTITDQPTQEVKQPTGEVRDFKEHKEKDKYIDPIIRKHFLQITQPQEDKQPTGEVMDFKEHKEKYEYIDPTIRKHFLQRTQ